MKKLINWHANPKLASFAPFVLRVATGLVFLMHGWQKLQGGIPGTAAFLGMLGFPVPSLFAMLLIAAEVIGGALLILGLYTHHAAKILAFVALVAFLTVHATKGFFAGSGGYEFIMLLFAAAISLSITGPGRWSLASALGKK